MAEAIELGQVSPNASNPANLNTGIQSTSIENNVKKNVVKEKFGPKHMWEATKNSSIFERISFIVLALAVLFSILVVIYYFAFLNKKESIPEGPLDWYIPRDVWAAAPPHNEDPISFEPTKLVVIQHSGMNRTCEDFVECSLEMQRMQEDAFAVPFYDITYNFIIGNDGRVYEGRGWGLMSVSSRWLNRCLLSIGFVGDYRYIQPTYQQLHRAKLLLEQGVREGHLDPDYGLVGASDLMATDSPGTNLLEAIQDFDHYVYRNQFRYLACEQIHETEDNPFVDEAPHEWFVTREDWEAIPFNNVLSTEEYNPLKLVIISDFSSRDCYVFIVCRSQLQNLQHSFSGIAYNFMIGNDGRAYETRGWGVQANETRQFQPCALYIGFFGDYTNRDSATHTYLTPEKINRTMMLLEQGVKLKYLHPEYKIVGARDVLSDQMFSPGTNLYNEIQTWDHYDSERVLNVDSTCESLHSEF